MFAHKNLTSSISSAYIPSFARPDLGSKLVGGLFSLAIVQKALLPLIADMPVCGSPEEASDSAAAPLLPLQSAGASNLQSMEQSTPDTAAQSSATATTIRNGTLSQQESGANNNNNSNSQATTNAAYTDMSETPDTARLVYYTAAFIASAGIALGLLTRHNPHLPTPSYRLASSCIGYVCFTAWSVSFYPQCLLNYHRQSTRGVSIDFLLLNWTGFACYSIYTLGLYASPVIHQEYKQRYGDNAHVTVQSNDVAFAIHALIMSTVTLCQVVYYKRPDSRLECSLGLAVSCTIVATMGVLYPLLLYKHALTTGNWLDYIYRLSYIKVAITTCKYIPQVLLNRQRQSTAGWSIYPIILDFTGGLLNNLQLVGDALDMQDWTGITGNPAKLCLGSISMVFDTVFVIQHYCMYREQSESPQGDSGDATERIQQSQGSSIATPLLPEEEQDEVETAFV
jgi:cystinosin